MFQLFFSGRGLVLFFLGRSENDSTTEFLSKSLPGTPYDHRTGSPAVSPRQLKLD
jgi:hypothetical protein